MSAMNVYTFKDAKGRGAGPGAAGLNLQNLNWLHRSRVWKGWPDTEQSLTLAALNRPDIDGWLAAQLSRPASPTPIFLELRQPTAWDRGVPGPRVLVHTRNGEGGPDIVGGGWNPSGALRAGQQLTLPISPTALVVHVDSIDASGARASVRIREQPGAPLMYGSTIRLTHVQTGVHLHSHPFVYSHPQSSGQQQVTGFGGADENDLWMVKGPDGQPADYRQGAVVQHGEHVRLEHVRTRRNLHSHHGIPSPVTHQQEVTCFGSNGVGDGNDDWSVQTDDHGPWLAGSSVRLVHVLTDVALHSHAGFSDPKWTLGQQEVTGFAGRDENDLWLAGDLAVRAARFVAQNAPRSLDLRQTVRMTVVMRNLGTSAWLPGSHRLGSQSPQDNTVWGAGRVELTAPVNSGQVATFQFDITAPSSAGTRLLQWRMVEEGVEWFGDLTPRITVTVRSPGAPVAVPDVRNEPRVLADREIRDAGLVAAFAGAGVWVASQSPAAGTTVPIGSTITCRLTSRPPF